MVLIMAIFVVLILPDRLLRNTENEIQELVIRALRYLGPLRAFFGNTQENF